MGVRGRVLVFGEHVHTGGWLALTVAAAELVAVCTVALARPPLLQESEEPPGSAVRPGGPTAEPGD